MSAAEPVVAVVVEAPKSVPVSAPMSRLATPTAILTRQSQPWSSSIFACYNDIGTCKQSSKSRSLSLSILSRIDLCSEVLIGCRLLDDVLPCIDVWNDGQCIEHPCKYNSDRPLLFSVNYDCYVF